VAVETLIVDDSESFRGLLRKRLEKIGCVIIGEAGNAKQGLESFRLLKPKLVTLDIMMPDEPDFTCKELFATIRKERPDTSIVVISMSSKGPLASQFMSHGAVGYLEKSFMNFDELRRKLAVIYPDIR
jgi:two-component system chemotaxis response regulator CheY